MFEFRRSRYSFQAFFSNCFNSSTSARITAELNFHPQVKWTYFNENCEIFWRSTCRSSWYMLKSRDRFKDMKKKKPTVIPEDAAITFLRTWKLKFFLGGACPTILLGWSTFGEHLSEPSLNPGLSPNAQIVSSFLRLNLRNSCEWLSGYFDNILILSFDQVPLWRGFIYI